MFISYIPLQCYQCDSAIDGIDTCDDRLTLTLLNEIIISFTRSSCIHGAPLLVRTLMSYTPHNRREQNSHSLHNNYNPDNTVTLIHHNYNPDNNHLSSVHKGELTTCPSEESMGCYIIESEISSISLFYEIENITKRTQLITTLV